MDAHETHGRAARSGKFRARAPECMQRSCANALVRFPEFAGDVAIRKRKTKLEAQNPSGGSGCAADVARRNRAIREKIIGHRMGVFRRPGSGQLAGGFELAMFHEPAGQQSRGRFFHPLIDQSRNFLAQVGRMAQPGKFIALQTVARCREEKLPRRLRFMAGQTGLLRGEFAGVK